MIVSRIEFADHEVHGDMISRYIDWSAQPEHGPGIIGLEIGDRTERLCIPLTLDELGELLDDIDSGRDCYANTDDSRLPGHVDRFFDWSDTDTDTTLLTIGHSEEVTAIRLTHAEFATISPAIRATLP